MLPEVRVLIVVDVEVHLGEVELPGPLDFMRALQKLRDVEGQREDEGDVNDLIRHGRCCADKLFLVNDHGVMLFEAVS